MSQAVREAKMMRDILVVKSDILYADVGSDRPGFIPYDQANFEEIILEHFEYQQRGKMEEDTSYQQPIPYVIIHNPNTNKFIAYQRGGHTSVAGEKRLFGKWSLGVGGHIEKEQANDENPIRSTLYKEIEEEIGFTDINNVHTLGYIVDGSGGVADYHIGILCIAETATENVTVVDGELKDVYFLSEEEVEEIIVSPEAELETWSYIAREAYKKSKKA